MGVVDLAKRKGGDPLDIHSTEMHLYHVKEYLEVLKDSDTKLYSKTKKKLMGMSTDMLKCVQLIADILQEESLMDVEQSTEFTEASDPVDSDVDVSGLESEMNTTRDKIEKLSHFTNPNETKSSPVRKGTHQKFVITTYGNVLAGIPLNMEGCSDDALSCANLLKDWFNIRFFQCVTPDFHYNVRNFPIWVRNIILCYGKHMENYTQDEFCRTFRAWLSDIQRGATGKTKYSVPYEIFLLGENITKDDVSLSATILWDMLYDYGLYALSNSELGESALQSETMYNLCTKYDPTIMDHYEYYADANSNFKEGGVV